MRQKSLNWLVQFRLFLLSIAQEILLLWLSWPLLGRWFIFHFGGDFLGCVCFVVVCFTLSLLLVRLFGSSIPGDRLVTFGNEWNEGYSGDEWGRLKLL